MSRKVWIVFRSDYETSTIIGIYDDFRKAETIKSFDEKFSVVKYKINELTTDGKFFIQDSLECQLEEN